MVVDGVAGEFQVSLLQRPLLGRELHKCHSVRARQLTNEVGPGVADLEGVGGLSKDLDTTLA